MEVHPATFRSEVLMDDVNEVPDVERIAPFQIASDLLDVRLNLNVAVSLRIRFTPTNDPVVGFNLDKQEVLARTRIPEMSLDVRYFHWREASRPVAL